VEGTAASATCAEAGSRPNGEEQRQGADGARSGPPYAHEVAYPRVYVEHLRQKLEPEPSVPRWFLTEPGVGYRLVERDEP